MNAQLFHRSIARIVTGLLPVLLTAPALAESNAEAQAEALLQRAATADDGEAQQRLLLLGVVGLRVGPEEIDFRDRRVLRRDDNAVAETSMPRGTSRLRQRRLNVKYESSDTWPSMV